MRLEQLEQNRMKVKKLQYLHVTFSICLFANDVKRSSQYH